MFIRHRFLYVQNLKILFWKGKAKDFLNSILLV